MKMKLETENEFVRGTVSGAISATAICLFSELFEAIGLAKHCWLYLAGQPIMNFNHGFLPTVFAILLHLGIGSFWGVISAFLFSKVFTDRYYLLKGIVIGFAIFFLHFGLLNQTFHYRPALRADLLTLFIFFLSYLLYGGLTAFLLRKLPLDDPS
ncbi:MAG: hypothetical protein GX050_03315 [Firmicutes bacterium]|nr:hypothetical protein [Bacillota bacterium]